MAMIMTMTSAGNTDIGPEDRYNGNNIDHGNNNGSGEQPQPHQQQQQQQAGHILVGSSDDTNVVVHNNDGGGGGGNSHCAIHHCDVAVKMEEKRALAFTADACALCCLELTGSFILLLYLVQVGIWSWIFHKVYVTMPQTFSWEKLLRTFGSQYDDCVDRSTANEIELKPPSLCPNFFTAPAVPIISILCLILNFFAGCSCLSKPRSKKMYTMVGSSVTWQFIFTVIALVFVSVYFHMDIRGLEKSMMRELSKGIPETSRWHLTQIINKCCGIHSFSDWKITSGQHNDTHEQFKYPSSCYSYSSSSGGGGGRRPIFHKTACCDIEYANVKFYAIFEISLLCSGLLTTMFFFCLATAIHGGARGHWSTRGGVGAAAMAKDDAVGTTGIVFLQRPARHGHLHFHHGHHMTLEEAESLGFSSENYEHALQTS